MDVVPEYLRLFRAVSDALEQLGKLGMQLEQIQQQLIRAQQDAEELYISRETKEDEA